MSLGAIIQPAIEGMTRGSCYKNRRTGGSAWIVSREMLPGQVRRAAVASWGASQKSNGECHPLSSRLVTSV